MKAKNVVGKTADLFMAGVLASAVALVGCAGMPPPTEEVAISKSAVDSAQSAGGPEFAPVEFKSAQDKSERAAKALDKDNEKALFLAEAATVDAKLAEEKAHALKAEKALRETRDGQRALQEEIQRQQTP